jgi:tetratricopeptide (TPR) repeat protein
MYYAYGMAPTTEHKKKKNIRLIAIYSAVAVILVAGVWYAAMYFIKQAEHTKHEPTVPYVKLAVADVPLKAAAYSDTAGFDGGLAYYDVQISNNTDPAAQRLLLVYKSDFARNAKKYEIALESLQRAERISPDVSVTIALAQLYEAKGDKKAAIAKYNEAIAVAEASSNDFADRYSYQWKYKVEALSQ